MNSRTYKGFFKPKNKSKYKGDPTNIIYRSSYELKFMIWCDSNSSVIEWASEEHIIPYKSPLDNRYHRYFVDFYIKVKNKAGLIDIYLIEIKPSHQTREPVIQKQKKKTKKYITEVTNWLINNSKWNAAEEYCSDRKWKFKILTEKELNIR